MRIDDCTPRVVVSASCGIEPARIVPYKPLLDEALEIATASVDACVVLQREACAATLADGRDHDWHALVRDAAPADCVPMRSTDPLYILYTSGTTGRPKGVVRDTGGQIVALKWTMKAIYDADPGDVYWAASDIGWVVGHSYIVYGPLLQGCTSILYEGKPVGTPDAGAFWRVIAEHRVKTLFTAPTAFRVIRKTDPEAALLAEHDISSLDTLFLAGERCDPDTLRWAERTLDVPVIDHWWQTETSWSICANPRGIEKLPVKPGSPSVAAPGYDLVVLDADGREVPRGDIGAICARLPAAAGHLHHALERARALPRRLLQPLPRFLRDGRCGLHRRGRLRVRHGAHRRRHQRRRAPPLDRGDGGGAGEPPGRGRVRGDGGSPTS